MAMIHGSSFSPKNSILDLGSVLGRALGNMITDLATSLWDL